MIEMKEKTLAFFREMEANIMSKIEKARQIDEENAKRRANSHSEGEEDGFYYLDDRGMSYELNDTKETDSPSAMRVPFANNSVTTSQSTNNLEAMNTTTRPSFARAASGSVDYGSFDPKLANRARKNSSSGLGAGPPRRIRTISTMDGK